MSNNQKSSFSDLAKKMVNGNTAEAEKDMERNSYANYPTDNRKQNTTIIAEDTVITGDIKTKGNLDIKGQLEGNVDAAGYVNINGKVHGDVRAEAVTFSDADHEGNVLVSNKISINQTSSIVGNVSAGEINIDGSLTGDIEVKGNIRIDSHAIIHGNIKSASISVGQGAIINGVIETKVDSPKKESLKEETTSSILNAMEFTKK